MNDRAKSGSEPAPAPAAAPDPFAQAYARIRAQRPLTNRRLKEISADLREGTSTPGKRLRVFLPDTRTIRTPSC